MKRAPEIKLQNVKKLESREALTGGVAHGLSNILNEIVSYSNPMNPKNERTMDDRRGKKSENKAQSFKFIN